MLYHAFRKLRGNRTFVLIFVKTNLNHEKPCTVMVSMISKLDTIQITLALIVFEYLLLIW